MGNSCKIKSLHFFTLQYLTCPKGRLALPVFVFVMKSLSTKIRVGLTHSFFPLLFSGLVHAALPVVAPTTLPTGGQVVAGNATISSSSTANNAVMNVNQTSQRAVVNWDSFNVGKNATVNFNQPNANAVTLNRVTGASASVIDGAIKANGQVILVNPNGVTFGKGSEVHAAAVVASTLNMADKEFMDGKHNFKDDGTGVGNKAGKIINKGAIQTNNESGEGGFIALLAPEVRNQGYLLAQKGGTVAIGSGSHITLHIQGQSLVAIKVEEGVYNGLISNKRIIEAPGGLVVLATGAANQLMAGIIKNTGKISADSLVNNGGVIELVAKNVSQAGTISANSQTKDGGQVNLTGQEITLAKNSQTTASGATGGGQVNIGLANTQGSGGTQVNSQSSSNAPEVIKANADQAANTKQLAKTVTIEQNATIDTSATQAGNGGSIAIWSELKTTVAGILKSMGGVLSGNGGFIETSSKGQVALAPTASINTSANNPTGKAGTWLLDPIDLTIDQAAANLISQILTNSNVTIAVTNSTTACPMGSCTQTNGGTSSLTIASGADILKSGANYTTLTLSSEGIFNLNANISGQNLDVIIQSSIAYLGVGTSINASKVTVQAQTIYSAGTIQTNNYLNNVNPGSLGNAIQLLAQAIYVSGRLSANAIGKVAGNITLTTDTITLNAGALLEANGDEGGQITIAANDSIFSSATIQANGGNGRGGTLSITAANDQYFEQAALQANGTTDGGAMTITTSRGDIYFSNSIIQTNGSTGRGGSIGMSATNSTNIASSNISANGYSQGGQILIGNDAANGSLPFSLVTSFDEHTTINAAQLDTNPANQAGGFIETSGHTLQLLSSINAGRGGMWLLDPTDVTIDSITAANIVNQLSLGTSVTIQTTATTPTCTNVVCPTTPSGSGDITVSSDIIVGSASGVGNLTLTAYNNIAINANITLYGNLTLNAQVVNVASGATIQLNTASGEGVNLLPPAFNSLNWVANGSYGTNGLYTAINAGPVGRVVYYSRAISGLVVGQSYTLKFSTFIPTNPGTCGGVVANCAALYMGALWVTGSNTYTSITTPSSGVGITGSGPVAAGTGYTIISNMSAFTPTEGVTSVSTSTGNATQLSTTTNGVVVTANVVALSSTMTLEYIVRNDPSFSQVWNASLVSNSTPSILTINNSSTAIASNIQGVIAGSSGTSFVKQGAGALILSGINTYDGGTTVGGGALRIANNSALGAGALSLAASTSLHAAASAVSIANNISLTGSATINTPEGNAFNISGVVNEGGHGLIVAGLGNLTLSNTSNVISSLSSSGSTGALVIKNSGAMTLGSGSSGLSSISMDIETITGNITIAGDLYAASSSSSAIVIAAGTALLQGSSTTGSDILISGAPTISTGAGGRATLFTGTLSGSTGFTSAVVAAGNYRYNSTMLISGYTAPLSSGVYLIYRQRPVLTIMANNVNMIYGASSLPAISVSMSGLRNGDSSSSVVIGTGVSSAPIFNPATGTSTAVAGTTYSITPSGYLSTLGYSVTNVSGILTMVAAPLTVRALGVRKQEGSVFTGGNGVALIGLTNFDTASSLVGAVSYSGSSQGASTAGAYVIQPGGLSSSNYEITFVSGVLVLTTKPVISVYTPPPVMVIAPPPPPVAAPPIAMVMAAPRPAAPPPAAAAAAEGGASSSASGLAAPPSAAAKAAAPPPAATSSAKAAGPAGAKSDAPAKSSSAAEGGSGKASGSSGKSSSSKAERVSKYEARRLAGGKSEGKRDGAKGGASGSKYAGKYANGARGGDKGGVTKGALAKAGGTAAKEGAPKSASAAAKPAPPREGKYNNLANAAANIPVTAPTMSLGVNNLPQLSVAGLPPIVGMPVEPVPQPIVIRGGDSLTQSYDDVPSIRNSGVANVGRSKTTENYHESLESVNLMSTLNLFIIR